MTEQEFFKAKKKIEVEIKEEFEFFNKSDKQVQNLSEKYKLAIFPYLYEFARSMWKEKHKKNSDNDYPMYSQLVPA